MKLLKRENPENSENARSPEGSSPVVIPSGAPKRPHVVIPSGASKRPHVVIPSGAKRSRGIPCGAQAHGESRAARKRITAALSIVLAGTLVIGISGGPLTLAAVADEGAGGAASAMGSAKAASGKVNETPKEEVVYARLSATGTVDNVYVVNVLKPASPGTVTDYGAYTAVQNLTDAGGVEQNGAANTIDVRGESASYQGDLASKKLPWSIAVAYELDGKRVEPSELAGKDGKLSIVITTKRDAAVDATFFENYLLQITVPFAAGKASDVATEDGQIALAGSDTQVTFTGLPGKDGSFKVTAQVSDFELSGITFAAVPFSMGIEAPDTEGLVSGFRQLGDGVGELKTGADGLASGAGELASGMGQAASGLGDLSAGAGQLVGGANELTTGAQGVAQGAQELAAGAAGLASGLLQYQQGLHAQAEGQRGSVVDTSQLQQAYENATQAYVAAFSMAYSDAKAGGLSIEEAMEAARSATTGQSGAMQSALANLMAAAGGNAGLLGAADALDGAAGGLSAPDAENSLIGGAQALASGANGLAGGASELAGGTSDFAAGASDLASGANEAAGGAGQLATGASQLSSGAQQLAAGTGTLYTEVQAIPDKVQEEIDAMMADYDKSDFKPVSFTSPQNTNVSLVQFVLSTAPIEKPSTETEPEPAPEQSIWDRFLALFNK